MQTSKQRNILRVLAALAIILLIMPFWVFVINERELAVVLRFGKPVREYVEPGVHFKVPFVETVRRLPKTLQYWGSQGEKIPDLPTRDDKKIELMPWAIWRINEPTSFVQRLRTEEVAEQRVRQITRSAIRDVISQYDLAELVRSTDRPIPKSSDYKTPAVAADVAPLDDAIDLPVDDATQIEIQHGRPKLIAEIKAKAQERLSQQVGADSGGRGIELLDVGISQIDFVESVRIKTFDRWIAERDSVSARNTNEGERLKQGIINEAKAEVERIEGEGQQKASEIKGAADAKVITRYAEAINTVGDFYTFQRTLEAYEKAIGQDSRMILTTDSQLLQLLKELPPVEDTQ
ncbi:protease modulator HflC [Roseimaritima ulvae]|uniref:Protein HflC n=1 Tax=Roseimaritima ulvae TaxID=980254 RepID=A0A5B9QL69_9BACT|nr:protease modulator HflC [Roseimaritima ulvae]QEG38759.1 Modulator of FtsH protease HflC [Roseimaritima ulvae]